MSWKSLAKVVVPLLVAALCAPVSAAAQSEGDFAATVAKLVRHLEAAEAEVQAEIEAVDRCIDDPDCVVLEDPDTGGLWIHTRDELLLALRLLFMGESASGPDGQIVSDEKFDELVRKVVAQKPETKRRLVDGLRARLVDERTELIAMRGLLAAELASTMGGASSAAASVDASASAAAAGDAGGSGSGPFEGMRTAVLDVNGYRVTVPVGDRVEYTVHCFATSLETQQDASAPPRRAANEQELVESIKNHPNACVPDAYYDRQLVIDVLVRQADGGPRLIGRVEGYDPGSGS